ncbi:MAG TPA: DEAD/DEAH box helicase [Hypericibacter adhaerens]|uniref:DEAD/DEAH box helicase n=1 Tax=Hypericibacter adhaerens TaxID=2602016 RepID=UPI002BC5A3B9|nr:DEAD/DEAH box helicase [Hypericibacter adhaerens]HWA46053.1 DEAD/DEAH box helicase [Hypericibacter adhaerens]
MTTVLRLNRPHRFHPAVAAWFDRRFGAPTAAQAQAWPAIQEGRHTLIAAPTGSGKTLAAFLAAIDSLVRQGMENPLPDETQVVYVSPLKALSNDIQRNLEEPLAGIREALKAQGLPDVDIRAWVRTGDTPSAERDRMRRRPPHIVVTTPESLYILLGSESGRRMLATTRTVIVDEIHALAPNKRGAHLALSLERLEALCGHPLLRIGLSATQKPIEAVARFLVGAAPGQECRIVDAGHVRARDLALEVPSSPLEAIMSAEVWTQVYDRLAELAQGHRTTLVFVNTRRMAERVARQLSERLGEDQVTAHHGSMARELRLDAEQRLKRGALKMLVATASLELGIDIGDVDLVCQLGSPRSIASFLQRIGRSGHAVGGTPKGRLFPLSRDELVECAALLDSVRRGELDQLTIPERPLDVLAQQIAAEVAAQEWNEDALLACYRRAWPYRDLSREDFLEIVRMLADGFSTRRGRGGALLHHDAVNHLLRGRRGARLTALTSGGTIPDTADYQVLLEPENQTIGTVNEDFAVESMAGDIFQLGNNSYRIMRVERGVVRVEDAHGLSPTIPFWLGEAPGRSDELSSSVSRLREAVATRLQKGRKPEQIVDWLATEAGIAAPAAEQMAEYLAASHAALGCLPTQDRIVLERFFDEAGGMQLVIHSPYGSRINRAWGLALRKRYCRKFNFELQAAATEDNIVLSLTTAHSFELGEAARYLNSANVRTVLIAALLDAPMFATRWRWVAGTALALPRQRGGKRVPPQLARMAAEDLIVSVFPDQLACAENLVGEREIPDHPLVNQTIADCLNEAMDIAGLERLLARLEAGAIEVVARDLTQPSPLALEVLAAKPYAYLDDAPLEERRTQAVMNRRWLTPETASEIGRLDPEAIDRVRAEAWPEPANADELHDALVWLGFLSATEAASWKEWLGALVRQNRVTRLRGAGMDVWVAAERLAQFRALWPEARPEPAIAIPDGYEDRDASPEGGLVEILRGRLEGQGPVTPTALAGPLGLEPDDIAAALIALETEGFAMRGRFTPGANAEEWCARRLLARIHQYTLKRLRAEIEPVAARDFMRFLFTWQHVTADTQMEGPDAVATTVAQLEGFEAAAGAWETEILPARIGDYEPAWLDDECLAGRVAWARLKPRNGKPNGAERGVAPVRTTPITLLARRHAPLWQALSANPDSTGPTPSGRAQAVIDFIREQGASFFDELVAGTGLLRPQVEEALAELVALGLVASDSFGGLRALLVPSDRRKPGAGARRRRRISDHGMEEAGRWALARRAPVGGAKGPAASAEAVEHAARSLLLRYGVVFWRAIEREADWLPPWRELLRVYRRLEARGEIRGGRFVAGFSGEQFALPDAIGLLREIRRKDESGGWVSLSGADPLNLAGILTPGPKLAALTGNRLLYRDGIPIAALAGGEIRFYETLDPATEWQARKALLRGTVPAALNEFAAS